MTVAMTLAMTFFKLTLFDVVVNTEHRLIKNQCKLLVAAAATTIVQPQPEGPLKD
jgi:hypothetical protein